jgi:two-component system, NarL family, sensor histidine kinase DesK
MSDVTTCKSGKSRFWWMRYIWVVYSVFFIIDPIQRRSRFHWMLLAIVYPIFLLLYLAPNFTTGRKQLAAVGGMFLLGMIYVPYNYTAFGIFIFAMATLPFCIESPRTVLLLMGAGSVAILAEGLLLHMSMWTWGGAIFFSVIVGGANTALAQDKAANAKLRLAHEEVEHLAKVAERERIARDMHDVLGHTLSVIVLKAQLAEKLITRDPEKAASEIKDLETIARQALGEVREAIRGYRSEGLAAELERTQRTLDSAGVRLECNSTPPQMSAARETVLSLVLREAVTNIVRHARANRCKVLFSTEGDTHLLLVEDDGCGGIAKEGSGLKGMRERIEAMGGTLTVDSKNGTRLTVYLPTMELKPTPARETVAS